VTATPSGITPNGDGQGDVAELTFSLSIPANVTVEVLDSADTVAATVQDRLWSRAGAHSVTIDGAALADGAYSVLVRAHTATSAEVVASLPLTVSRTLGLVSTSSEVFSPNGDGRLDRLDVRFALTAAATVSVKILREGKWVASPLVAVSLPEGEQRITWDGGRSHGRLRDGSFTAVVEVTDWVGTVSYGVPFAADTAAPRITLLPGRRLRVSVSEPAVLRIWINGQFLRRAVKRPGIVLVRWPEPLRRARVVAWDAAGNRSPLATRVADSAPG
jgi:flagellar hook assembly protein FlgD